MGGERQWRGRPWERQPGESDKAWAAFEAYLRLGSGRSVRQAALKEKRAVSYYHRLSEKWAWSFRADQWDAIQNAAVARGAERAAITNGERIGSERAALARDMMEIARLNVTRLLEATRKTTEAMSPSMVLAFAELSDRIDRLQAGEPTDILAQQTNEAVVTVERELAQIRERLIRKEAES